MIEDADIFAPNRELRAGQLNSLAYTAMRSGMLSGGGRARVSAGNNPSVYVGQEPAFRREFWGRISIPTGGDYTDERYLIYRVRATGGANQTDQLTTEDDTPPNNHNGDLNEPWPITATNRAEKAGHTHSLTDGLEVLVTAEVDYFSNRQTKHYSFALSPPGGLAVHDCADAGGPATVEKFAGGFTVSFAGSVANVAPNIIADPASPGISVVNGNGATCGPVKIGCNGLLSDVFYSGGVFYKVVCGGAPQVVFSTTSCPTSSGVSAAEFFSYNN